MCSVVASTLADIPSLGVGLGYREELAREIDRVREGIDFVEVITERFAGTATGLERLHRVCDLFPVVPHGIGLSIGSMFPLDPDYLRAIRAVSDLTGSPYYSEHLCVTNAPGIDIGHLAPIWFTNQTLQNAIRTVSTVQDYLGKPLVLENVTYLIDLPGGDISQAEFFTRLVRSTGCGVLLDISNVYINAVNHRFDPLSFLERMPLDHVVQVHLAGGHWADGLLIDSHSEPIEEESWKLFARLACMADIKGVIVEHDRNFPAMQVLMDEIRRARQLLAAGRVMHRN
jgi:uncharacterized protein (UPF0276 family)